MPRAPKRRADSTALRIARRNATRFSSCIATDSEMSCASSSGFWISWMLMKTSRLVFFWISCFSLSTSVPLRPMMMPGREVKMSIYSRLTARSVSIFETPACAKRVLSVDRSARSSCSSLA